MSTRPFIDSHRCDVQRGNTYARISNAPSSDSAGFRNPACDLKGGDFHTTRYGVEDVENFRNNTSSLTRSKTGEEWSSNTSVPTSLLQGHSAQCTPLRKLSTKSEELSQRRRFSLQLPSFTALGITSSPASESTSDLQCPLSWSLPVIHSQTQESRTGSSLVIKSNSMLPLTPPPEDFLSPKPVYELGNQRGDLRSCSASHTEGTNLVSNEMLQSSGVGRQGISLPQSLELVDPAQHHRVPWITRASHQITSVLSSTFPLHEIQIVSQTLPSQAIDSRSRPTFEDILEYVQTDMNPSPYITITHAVPQARVMEELPKTPPSTPNSRHEINDYFGGDQTIFTHAAVVPIYHTHERVSNSANLRQPHHIAAPYSTQISILERYIPPTTAEEIHDLFKVSPRSYLADRLSELSSSEGSLLLVYPTLNGGRTFTRNYIGPVIDPCLRQFVLLNGLTADAASTLGTMAAVDEMINFEEMKQKIETLCTTLTARPAIRGQRTSYRITHAETASVVLDRPTWINWYVEQEQSRLRQNLIEYHQAGGRMPHPRNKREVTVGMLVRDLVDGIQRSDAPAGSVDIEVGVFVITRSKL